MRFESCFVVLLASLVVFALRANADDDDDNNNNRHILARHEKIRRLKQDHEDKKNSSDDVAEKRSKRSLSYSERSTVLYNFNYQRGLVGASDMNYLDYDTALEVSLSNWTMRCNYDTKVYSYLEGDVFKVAYDSYPDHATMIEELYSGDVDTDIFNGVRSKYVGGVAGSVDFCSMLIFKGKIYYGKYLLVYGLLTNSDYDDTVQQYTPGPACSRCQSDVAWCFNSKLCRADCSLSVTGCCQISNGVQTSVCGNNPPSASRNGANKVQAVGTAMLYGLILIICYYFQ